MRFFNTAGPCEPERHYMVPAAGRLPDARRIIDQGGYFVVHAPRQTGKTTTLRALARELAVLYHEVAPQLVLMAYLQRIVNGGGYVDREYGVGRGRIDLCVRFPRKDGAGQRAWQREALELKVWAPRKPDPQGRGLEQLEAYLDRLGLDRGTLVIFDRRPEAPPTEERTRFEEARTPRGYAVTVLRA